MKLLREAHLKIETPAAMALRPVDHRGFPVPWFVTKRTEAGLYRRRAEALWPAQTPEPRQ